MKNVGPAPPSDVASSLPVGGALDSTTPSLDSVRRRTPLLYKRSIESSLAATNPGRRGQSCAGSSIIEATPMALASGTRVGSYEVIVQIGAGQKQEVYRARDTKLNRDVARTIPPDAFTYPANIADRWRPWRQR